MEGCCLFVAYQWGNPQAPIYRGNAEGAKLPHGYVAEKTSPGALELKKSPSSLDQEGLCKGLAARSFRLLVLPSLLTFGKYTIGQGAL
ncbi:MAG: hypothetical protein R6T98_15045 [Desulfatiglandales bacterium]